MTQEEWAEVEWDQPNRVLMRRHKRSEFQVAAMRKKHGHPATFPGPPPNRWKYSSEKARAAVAKRLSEYRPKVVEMTIKDWALVSPRGRRFKARNLREFVRGHPELFDAADLVIGRGGSCRAMAGLYRSAKTGGTWKGWTCLHAD